MFGCKFIIRVPTACRCRIFSHNSKPPGEPAGRCFFPPILGTQPDPRPCDTPAGERPLHLITDFIDFGPLVRLRKELNKRFAGEGVENIPLGCLFLWCLARQPEFEGVKFAIAVDVPANKTKARGVDLVPIRPADDKDAAPFSGFVREFNRLIVEARERRTGSYKAMHRLSLLPAFLASAALELVPAEARSTFGTVGVSIVRDAKVVVAPMADRGFDGGYISLGSMSLPCPVGATTAISVKGEYEAIRRYPIAIRQAVQKGRSYFS